ncbi:MAG: PDZ domain-containing protein [Actinobacteria bacterium]|nr:PDZ domain-containing protein [Actinomycetota bacterium]
MTSTYLRYPRLRDDLLTFVGADDVWVAPTDGGRAWRLTHDRVPVRNPRLSPDGTTVAYVSHRDGHPEIMVAELDGAAPQRLTWWGAAQTLLLGWSADGRVLAASHAGEANLRLLTVRAVALDGAVERLRYGPAWGVAERADGAVALSSAGSRPPAEWKRYRGGTAPRLWLDRSGDGDWEQLLAQDPASLVDPMWVQDRLVFVSDRAATFPDRAAEQANLWVWDEPGSGEPRLLTRQGVEHGYVRDATTDGHRVTWHSRGCLWILDDLTGTPRHVEVSLPGSAPTRFAAGPQERLTALSPDHGGDASLLVSRGAAFWLSHREGPARALVADSSVRAREVVVLGQTGSVALVTDAEGEDSVEVHDLTGAEPPRRVGVGRLGRVLHLAADPAGTRLATIAHDGRVRLVDVTDGTVEQVGHSTQGEAASPSFSPDGRYLVWSQPTHGEAYLHQLMVLDTDDAPGADGRAPVALTSGTFHDHDPAFTRDGKHLVLLSERTFDPDYDSHEFALSFSSSTRPWLLPLSATEPAPFGPSAQGWRISKPDKPEAGTETEGSSQGPAPACPDLDADGAEQRLVPFPVPSADYRDLRAAKDGVLWVRQSAGTGELGARRAGVSEDADPDTLEHWSFEQRRVQTVVDKVEWYAVAGDGERVVVWHDDDLRVSPADHKPEEEEDHDVITVDLSRVRLEVDPRAEWRQMFDDNARIMATHYWRADMNGVDWSAALQRWRPVVEQLSTHDDLVDLLWETNAELNTSHAYVIPADPPGDQDRALGLLGADLGRTTQGWVIERILPGESSDPAARSPLQAAGVGARAGDVIVAVDGSVVDPAYGPAASLLGTADKPVELTLRRDGADRRVVVVPLAQEETLRYQDWVRSRRDYVREHSAGRLGYLHIPDMMSTGWAQLHRDLRRATLAEGLVVDVRYNRGGHTSQLVLARLSSTVVGWGRARHYEQQMSYPSSAPRGPVVLVANEYSGSDGDIVNAAGQAMGLGPVVGVRTWGGVVGIDGRFDLVDGTSITQPRYAFWLQGKEWDVENHGVDPDIEVRHAPADFFGHRDPQLDRAIAEALEQLGRRPAAAPPPLPQPRVRSAD